MLTPTTPPSVALAIAEAVSACAWEPGTANGKPINIWLVLPLNLTSD